jgi:hypothetical protein
VKREKEYLLELEDVVVVPKDEKGKVKLHQAVNLTAVGAVGGGFWGCCSARCCSIRCSARRWVPARARCLAKYGHGHQ